MYSQTELVQFKTNIVKELTAAKNAKPSSYPFIQNNLSSKSHIKLNETFQIIVLGGTTFRSALVKKHENGTVILKQKQEALPIFKSKKIFIEFVASKLFPDVQYVAINFAYAVEPILRNEFLDGILKHGSKEHQFEGLIGKTVGKAIEDYVIQINNKKIHVALANDTICLLFSGLKYQRWNHLAAGVVGTGLNFAIYLNEYTAVNLEAANFDKFKQSEEGIEVDKQSVNPGKALFEKETSGAYLYKHFNYYLRKNNIDYKPLQSTEELAFLVSQKIPRVSEAAQRYLDRSAMLVAAHIAGIVEFYKKETAFVMQGSLFWNNVYKQKVEETLSKLELSHTYSFSNIENSEIIGASFLI